MLHMHAKFKADCLRGLVPVSLRGKEPAFLCFCLGKQTQWLLSAQGAKMANRSTAAASDSPSHTILHCISGFEFPSG